MSDTGDESHPLLARIASDLASATDELAQMRARVDAQQRRVTVLQRLLKSATEVYGPPEGSTPTPPARPVRHTVRPDRFYESSRGHPLPPKAVPSVPTP